MHKDPSPPGLLMTVISQHVQHCLNGAISPRKLQIRLNQLAVSFQVMWWWWWNLCCNGGFGVRDYGVAVVEVVIVNEVSCLNFVVVTIASGIFSSGAICKLAEGGS